MIILSAFFFACMNVSVRLAGDLPSIQKSFFRNLVAAIFAAIILGKNHIVPKVQKQYWGALLLRCAFGTLVILCNFFFSDFERKDYSGAGNLCAAGIYRMPFCGKTGISECSVDSCADRSLRRTWSRNCIYNGACAGNTWGERPDHCILLFCIFLPVCASVSDFRLYSDDRKTARDASDGGPFCSRRSVYDHSSIYVCTGR